LKSEEGSTAKVEVGAIVGSGSTTIAVGAIAVLVGTKVGINVGVGRGVSVAKIARTGIRGGGYGFINDCGSTNIYR
tara:strand:- start:642 stop:869 length:228 start_codon:yes stop_codon:yes gene_type:complete